MRFLIKLLVEGFVVGGIYWLAGRQLRKFGFKLGENAVLGWIDDRIGEALGISAPTLATLADFVWDWGLPLVAVAAILWVYHQFNRRWSANGEISILSVLAAAGPPLWRVKTKLDPHFVAIGFGIVVLGVAVAGYGFWKNPPSPRQPASSARSSSEAIVEHTGDKIYSPTMTQGPAPRLFGLYVADISISLGKVHSDRHGEWPAPGSVDTRLS
jgi:hypothetical protein